MEGSIPWGWVRGELHAHRTHLRHCLRLTVAALLAVAISHGLGLHRLWPALTAVLVTQASVGGSLRAAMHYMIGTLGGAAYAAAVSVLIPHSTALSEVGVLALAIAPLALAASLNSRFRIAPFSALIVLLIGGEVDPHPIQSAAMRVSEVALGGVVALAVSTLVLPERADKLELEEAARVLDRIAANLASLLAGFVRKLDMAEVDAARTDLGISLAAFQTFVVDAKRERMAALAPAPDFAPLLPTLIRLRHDLVILAGAASPPLSAPFAQRVGPPLARVGEDASRFLRDAAAALGARRAPPALEPAKASLDAFEAEVAALRRERATNLLSMDEAERLFALGFALRELFRNFAELQQRVQDRARPRGGKDERSPLAAGSADL